MNRRRVVAGVAAVLVVEIAVLAAGRISPKEQAAPTPSPVAAADLPTIPPETEQFANDWPVPQGNLSATRSAARSSITSANVGQLEVAWTFDLPAEGAWGSITANPIVVGGTVYIQDMQSNIFALDRATGLLKWKAMFNVPSPGPNGVAVGYGMVFAALSDTGEVVALHSNSGTPAWRRTIGSPPGEGIDMAPIAYGGLVYVSTVPGSAAGSYYRAGDRGVLYGLDATNGQVVWWFDTTHGGSDAPRIAGGGGLWYPPSFDAAGNLYFGVGNPAPYPLTKDCPNGSCRPGDNEYANSMVSLDGKTGGVRWFYQDRKHDLLDHDFQHTPILATVDVDGTPTPIAVGAGKSGNVVAVQSETGEVLWKRPVGKHLNDDVTALPTDGFLEVFPGGYGGVESPIAYANGSVFATYLDLPQYQGATGIGPDSVDFATGTGGLVAIDAADGSVTWETKLNTLAVGGATVANDVVFTSGLDGFLRAFHADTGGELWSYEAQKGFNAPPAIAGDMVFVGAGFVKIAPAEVAAAADPSGQGGPVPSKLIAFRIGR